ncbi:sulfotransferase [uncultured Pseudodesulfovibrio sp.]|uniref:sulfotransferase n=1 Tax=uncultured Pseudodesulfovibrio sp. TaxID=2035858 RepID=UPI0029C81264|nr:sulfotransferase [uncultured Pseudodesulfovibrio sp.]
MPTPTFLYVGSAKCASTWMWRVFDEHPEIFVTTSKELMFFNDYYERGTDWYLSHFENGKEYACRGELSHDYFLKSIYAERIHKDFPDVKILCCLREPMSLLRSYYKYDRRIFKRFSKHEHANMDFIDFAKSENVNNYVDYYSNLTPFYELFPRNKIHVMFYEDLVNTPMEFYTSMLEFLQVSPSHVVPSAHKIINPAMTPRNALLSSLATWVADMLRRHKLESILGILKANILLEKLFFSSKKPPIDLAIDETSPEYMHLYREFHKYDDKLSSLIGKNLPKEWSEPAN